MDRLVFIQALVRLIKPEPGCRQELERCILLAFGDTSAGRHLMVVYESVDASTVYPITAYEAPRRY